MKYMMEKFLLEISITNKSTGEVIIKSTCVMIEKDCDKFLKSQLKFINELKSFTDLNIEISYNKI